MLSRSIPLARLGSRIPFVPSLSISIVPTSYKPRPWNSRRNGSGPKDLFPALLFHVLLATIIPLRFLPPLLEPSATRVEKGRNDRLNSSIHRKMVQSEVEWWRWKESWRERSTLLREIDNGWKAKREGRLIRAIDLESFYLRISHISLYYRFYIAGIIHSIEIYIYIL